MRDFSLISRQALKTLALERWLEFKPTLILDGKMIELIEENIPDPNDRASVEESMHLQDLIEINRRSSGPKATGKCLYCDEPLVSGLIIKAIANGKHNGEGIPKFCDCNCTKDYEHMKKRESINIRVED